MPSPIIGITTGRVPSPTHIYEHSLPDKYVQAVLRAGGTPVILPAGLDESRIMNLVDRLDGIILSGGGDIDPEIFNGRPHPNVYGIDNERDFLEIELVRQASQSQKPFLGICRGAQVINVAFGGTLFTDIAAQVPDSERHDFYPKIPRDKIAHEIKIQNGSLLRKLTGKPSLAVNSLHHQGIDQISAYLQPSAYSADGLVEAVELRDHPFGLGVQWHPEWLVDTEGNLAIFRGLVQAAENHR